MRSGAAMQSWEEDIEKVLSGLRTVDVPRGIEGRIKRRLRKHVCKPRWTSIESNWLG